PVCVCVFPGRMSGETLDYFLGRALIQERDAAEIVWYHAANSKSKIAEALRSSAHMIEADVILRGEAPREPVMAHPPDTDSDITLRDWLNEVLASDKGIKLDFKSLPAVRPSLRLLERVWERLQGPLWINADVLPGPGGGGSRPLDPEAFLAEVGAALPGAVLSLGWTTGGSPQADNTGYSWEMVREMEAVCRALARPVSFPVRAALLRPSFAQLRWLLQQSDRYSLTVWTGQGDIYPEEDLLLFRQDFDKSRIYYDVPEAQGVLLTKGPG
uniref:Family with sequence similarity 151 member B n=1 Tax=Lepisosteus oculatus TaxID=7918 RepID=W5MD04_LEPOC